MDKYLENKVQTCLNRAFIRKIKHNYNQFKERILSLDKESIFEMTDDIVITRKIFKQITDEEFYELCHDEAVHLLKFYNPLEIIVDMVKSQKNKQCEHHGFCECFLDIDVTLERVFAEAERDGDICLEDEYLTVAHARELQQKYSNSIDNNSLCDMLALLQKERTLLIEATEITDSKSAILLERIETLRVLDKAISQLYDIDERLVNLDNRLSEVNEQLVNLEKALLIFR